MWEKMKIYGKAILGIATDVNTNMEFAQKKLEDHHDLNNTYNTQLLEYTKNIRAESNESTNWDHTHPLDAMEAMQEAEKVLNRDIERYMNSDDIEQRAFGYKMKMDHYNDLYNGARSEEEKEMIKKAMDLESQKAQQRERQIQDSNQNSQNNKAEKTENKSEDKKEENCKTNEEIDNEIRQLQEQIERLQKLKK